MSEWINFTAQMSSSPKAIPVLICPQHWGLGHVTRTIPVIRYFIERGYQVHLACSGAGADLLRLEFPDLPLYTIADYKMRYPRASMYWNMGIQMWQLHSAIFREHRQINKICREKDIRLIVSDSRFGAFARHIPCVVIAHHLHLPLGNRFMEFFTDLWMRIFYLRFDQIWVPDFDGPVNISGDLTRKFRSKKHYFIGPLSRFSKLDLADRYDCAFVLSGPEPQRSYLEDIILKQLPGLGLSSAILIRGTREGKPLPVTKGLAVIDLAAGTELNRIMSSSRLIVCRSGYSSLLDLSVLRKPALLISTPGQPEQEYLARELHRKGLFLNVAQNKLDLSKHLKEAEVYPGFHSDLPAPVLSGTLDDLLSRLKIK